MNSIIHLKNNPKVPRIYGAPKTHKPGKKLRPITSNIDVPSEIVAKRLAYQFKQFPGPSGFYVENTQEAIKKLRCNCIVPECTN
jgi:hypothetical protein